ncbi:MAG: glycine cleavage system protein H [Bacteroidales bacterium]|nr:glycine cleavage system protein H [Bacteroidales bacterium]
MESFSYTNIFETKGIEYIAIIIFFVILIPFWILLNKKVKITGKIKKVLGFLSENILKFPLGIYHTKNHTWAFLEKNGEAKVGLNDLLLHITGEVKINPLKKSGEMISKGDLFIEIEQGGKQLQLFSPISGKILNSNEELNNNPEIANEDPYGEGWVYKIKPSAWKTETNSYYLAEETTNWSKMELVRFKDFMAASAMKYSDKQSMLILQDGGELSENSLSETSEEVWKDFQKGFLNMAD